MTLQQLNQVRLLTIGKSGRIKTKVNVQGAHMRHIHIVL